MVRNLSEKREIQKVKWPPEFVRCLRMCGYKQSQHGFGETIGVTGNAIHFWESGERVMHASNAYLLEKAGQKIGWTAAHGCHGLCGRTVQRVLRRCPGHVLCDSDGSQRVIIYCDR